MPTKIPLPWSDGLYDPGSEEVREGEGGVKERVGHISVTREAGNITRAVLLLGAVQYWLLYGDGSPGACRHEHQAQEDHIDQLGSGVSLVWTLRLLHVKSMIYTTSLHLSFVA